MERCGVGPRLWAWKKTRHFLNPLRRKRENADAVLSEIAERVNLEATV